MEIHESFSNDIRGIQEVNDSFNFDTEDDFFNGQINMLKEALEFDKKFKESMINYFKGITASTTAYFHLDELKRERYNENHKRMHYNEAINNALKMIKKVEELYNKTFNKFQEYIIKFGINQLPYPIEEVFIDTQEGIMNVGPFLVDKKLNNIIQSNIEIIKKGINDIKEKVSKSLLITQELEKLLIKSGNQKPEDIFTKKFKFISINDSIEVLHSLLLKIPAGEKRKKGKVNLKFVGAISEVREKYFNEIMNLFPEFKLNSSFFKMNVFVVIKEIDNILEFDCHLKLGVSHHTRIIGEAKIKSNNCIIDLLKVRFFDIKNKRINFFKSIAKILKINYEDYKLRNIEEIDNAVEFISAPNNLLQFRLLILAILFSNKLPDSRKFENLNDDDLIKLARDWLIMIRELGYKRFLNENDKDTSIAEWFLKWTLNN